jgi:uncharacterized protein
MSDLKISQSLALPIDAVTQTFAILAMRGRGKTYTASVMIEEMIEAGLPVCVIDPTGAWWGLRTSADGKKAGLPVVIFGGEHADVPLEPSAGRLIADLLVESPFPCVIDLSTLDSKAEEIRFMTDFLTRLYRANRRPLHLMIDEADEFAPQQSFPEGKRLLGAMEQIVRRGRIRGLGCTLITQRPAVLNKNVLSQTETLILLGMTGTQDLKAIDDWVGKHSDSEEARSIKGTLPSLPIGTAWVWSPSWLGITKKVRIRKRRTFDSSATPKVGERIEVRTMAPVDIEALGEQIRATVEKVEAEDPALLQKRIRHLESELLAAQRMKPLPERIEVPIFEDADRDILESLGERLAQVDDVLSRAIRAAYATEPAPPPAPVPKGPGVTVHKIAPMLSGVRREDVEGPAGSAILMPKAQRAVLTVLAQQNHRTVTQVALLAGYSSKGGGFRNALGALRSAGFIEGSSTLSITGTGYEALGGFEELPTGRALIEHHAAKLGKAGREILYTLCEPGREKGMSAEDLAHNTGYAPTGGGFRNALGKLRTLELIVTENGISRAADVLLS